MVFSVFGVVCPIFLVPEENAVGGAGHPQVEDVPQNGRIVGIARFPQQIKGGLHLHQLGGERPGVGLAKPVVHGLAAPCRGKGIVAAQPQIFFIVVDGVDHKACYGDFAEHSPARDVHNAVYRNLSRKSIDTAIYLHISQRTLRRLCCVVGTVPLRVDSALGNNYAFAEKYVRQDGIYRVSDSMYAPRTDLWYPLRTRSGNTVRI